MPEPIDLTTNRTAHLAAWRFAYAAMLTSATWWAFATDQHATTNVVVIPPIVTHFRAPLTGGPVEVQELDGSWSPADMTTEFRYRGVDMYDAEFGAMFAYTVAGFSNSL